MALFRKKQSEGDEPAQVKKGTFEAQPDKAQKWFEHARTAADSSNYDYALKCFANGIRLDPASMVAHKNMLDSAVRYMNQNGKPASSKEVRGIEDGSPVGKFAAAEFEWMKDLKNAKSAFRTLDTAVKAEQFEVGNWIAPKVLNLVRQQKKKLSKAFLLQAMQLFRDVGAWDESLTAGQMARELDPSDADLDSELKNLSAQRAMDQGGYDDAAGEEGGFRKFIKDAEGQRELIEDETLAAGATTEERLLDRARKLYEEAPTIPDHINRYAQLLRKRGTPESVEQARELYEKGFADTSEYRFLMAAGDIRIAGMENRLRELDAKVEATPDDATKTHERDTLRTELLDLKVEEYTARIAKYPTDRFRKFALGEVQFELGKYDDAMAQFQSAKDEPKLRIRAGHMLGRCFLEETWFAEAASELMETLQVVEATADRDRDLPIRYDLMVALLGGAEQDQSVDLAKDARTICSEIARRDITYRDIRAKRKEVDTLIKRLSGDG